MTSATTPVHTFSSSSLCYNLVLEKKKWQTAHSQCREAGGDMVTIHDNSTQTMLTEQLGRIKAVAKWNIWIGLYPFNKYQDSDDYLTWVDGKGSSQRMIFFTGEEGHWFTETSLFWAKA
jgi:hypothetical protein